MKKYRITMSMTGELSSVYFYVFDAENLALVVQRVLAALEEAGHEDYEIVSIERLSK